MIKTKNRIIRTAIPNKKSIKIFNKLKKIEPRGMHGQFPIVWKKAKDFSVYDHLGNKFIDFSSTMLVTNIGHSNTRVITDIKKLLKKPLMHTYNYASEERLQYLNNLKSFTPSYLTKFFLLSSGSEATEAALKLIRYNGKFNKNGKNIVLSFDGNWHGRTLGSEMMGGKENLKKWITSRDKNIIQLPFPYPWYQGSSKKGFFIKTVNKLLKSKNLNPKKDISGVMLESFQGWGTIFYPKQFIAELNQFCKKNDILIAFDEIQAGFGRTGKLFGYMHYDIKPDIVCCGKGAGSGYPLSLVLGHKKIMDLPKEGEMSSTHSANPLACAIGNATINEIRKKKLINNASKKGELLHYELNKLKDKYPDIIRYIFGKGLVASIIFYKHLISKVNKIGDECFTNGLIVVKTGRESIKIGPPLTISVSAIKEGIAVIEKSISNNFH
tara:strand:+ start:22 stop:1338 length:1317 start_codon:yes stop_codon:yes gene_type:complete